MKVYHCPKCGAYAYYADEFKGVMNCPCCDRNETAALENPAIEPGAEPESKMTMDEPFAHN